MAEQSKSSVGSAISSLPDIGRVDQIHFVFPLFERTLIFYVQFDGANIENFDFERSFPATAYYRKEQVVFPSFSLYLKNAAFVDLRTGNPLPGNDPFELLESLLYKYDWPEIYFLPQRYGFKLVNWSLLQQEGRDALAFMASVTPLPSVYEDLILVARGDTFWHFKILDFNVTGKEIKEYLRSKA